MAKKKSTIYVCSNCDAQFPKWSGRCLECGAWGSLQETIKESFDQKKEETLFSPAKIINLSEIKKEAKKRMQTGISEFDRVLGGGIVPGSLVLLAGEPGIGKSTIVAQIANAISDKNKRVLYVSGEESAGQIKERLERLKCDLNNIDFVSEINTEKIIVTVKNNKPNLVIVDSIQTIYSQDVAGEAGSITQIRASAVKFMEIAKNDNIPVFLIGHITKDGQVAGPKTLEHIVDTVVYLEVELTNDYRILRTTKNRFGSVNELGVFKMTAKGFEEIKNPSSIFIDASEEKISGSVISCVMEGTRPFLVEVQALVTKTIFGYPQRKSSGYDLNRLQVLSAVLTKKGGVNLSNQDIILNIVGGLKISDPSIDLAVCLAITSSLLNQKINRKTIVLGEVGLGGEIRKIFKIDERLKESSKLGFKKAIIPNTNVKVSGIEIKKVTRLADIIKSIT